MIRIAAATVLASLGAICVTVGDASALPAARTFQNCTTMHRVYPLGVGLPHAHDHTTSGDPVTNFKCSRPLYRANKKSDADHDGIACEEH